jgi:MYXO-CTERM domain-containing protein
VPPLVRYRPAKHFVGEDAFSFTVTDGEYTSAPAIVRVTVDGLVRRELDGDASWFGCTSAPSPHSQTGNYLPLLLIGLGLMVARRRRR